MIYGGLQIRQDDLWRFNADDTGNIAVSVEPLDPQGQPLTFIPIHIRIHLTGTAGAAALLVSLDHERGARYDAVLSAKSDLNVANATTRDYFWRLPPDEWMSWTVWKKSKLTLAWTNPNPGATTWGLEVLCYLVR